MKFAPLSLLVSSSLALFELDLIRQGNNPQRQDIVYIPGRKSMINPITVHLIWYGNNWKANQKSIVTDFLKGMDQSDLWKLTATYYNTDEQGTPESKVYVSKKVILGEQVEDFGSAGTWINNPSNVTYINDIPFIADRFIKAGKLPASTDAIYLVLADDQTLEGDACNGYCGYHTSVLSDQLWANSTDVPPGQVDMNMTNYKYSFIGNMKACGAYFNDFYCGKRNNEESPNGDIGVDRMLETIWHEIAEASSNPDTDSTTTAWNSDIDGSENADNCAYVYGAKTTVDKHGIWSNMGWNGRRFLIQNNWDPERQDCGPLYPENVPTDECAALQKILPDAYLGPDCCNSGFADCADGHIRSVWAGKNNLNGTVKFYLEYIQEHFPKIDQITLTGNNLVGEIPKSICKIKNLDMLRLNGNIGINGTIPDCIGHLKQLKQLQLSGTSITGTIPEKIAELHKLRQLLLANTNITGRVPESLGRLKSLRLLLLNDNPGLKGVFPCGFEGFNGLTVQPMNNTVCDASGTGLCLAKNHRGPTCNLSTC